MGAVIELPGAALTKPVQRPGKGRRPSNVINIASTRARLPSRERRDAPSQGRRELEPSDLLWSEYTRMFITADLLAKIAGSVRQQVDQIMKEARNGDQR